MAKPIVVIGFLGTQLDAGLGTGRWEKWRPTVALGQHDDRVITRLELLVTPHPKHAALAQRVKDDLATVSHDTQVNLVELPIHDPWDFGEVYGALYDWARSYAFDTAREQYWAHITTGTHVAQICLFLLAESRHLPGVLAQTSPPKRWGAGDAGQITLIDLDLSRYDAIAQRFSAAQQDAVSYLKSGIATRNARFNALIDEIERVAVHSTAPILLVGPTGAGKSFLARRMVEVKKARNQVSGPFVEVNCATLHGDGAMSTLFGHKKGAFTGAAADRAGLLKSAHEGVLFLDEIGELGLDEQAMLLKAVEEKRFYPLGSDREVESSFQLIAGTHRDLRREVAAGRFREDLFARINLWTYDLPGLAERREDIEPNIDHLLALHARAHRVVRFHPEARRDYLRFAQSDAAPWCGNFRDLSASITRLATLAEGGRISQELVAAEVARLRWLWQRDTPADAPQADGLALVEQLLGAEKSAALDLFDRLQLAAVLPVCAASRTLSDAGRQLFAASREQRKAVNDADRLRKYLMKFGLGWEQIRRAL
ncbi:RNA repair transcriptional activator RtcR [Ottowia testudinis]|uniref:RNA repair transcriptional activator RtcR n=1 Tax=Ottowia testudinis TaxID=2816950 RepID=A0A975CF94_9BURK|nr:RNA repair transcriptional activator RtcR [Ottowia testudinis]QTD45320.1 RNA repair transcriptional activator RtcR [Ottowia testudinis]